MTDIAAELPPSTYDGALVLFGIVVAIAVTVLLWLVMCALDCFVEGEKNEEIHIRRRGRVDHVYRVVDGCRHAGRSGNAGGGSVRKDDRNAAGGER